jgi:hypothetical protein
VKVTDPDGKTATDDATVTIENVAPTAAFGAPGSAFAGLPFTLSATGATDPSEADRQAGFAYAFDCGAGYGGFGGSAKAHCTSTALGPLGVGLKVRDKDGGVREYRATVKIRVTFDSLCDLTWAYSDEDAVAKRLCRKLHKAEHAWSPWLRKHYLERYRDIVADETPGSLWHRTSGRHHDRYAFTKAEGRTLIELSRRL